MQPHANRAHDVASASSLLEYRPSEKQRWEPLLPLPASGAAASFPPARRPAAVAVAGSDRFRAPSRLVYGVPRWDTGCGATGAAYRGQVAPPAPVRTSESLLPSLSLLLSLSSESKPTPFAPRAPLPNSPAFRQEPPATRLALLRFDVASDYEPAPAGPPWHCSANRNRMSFTVCGEACLGSTAAFSARD